MLLNSDKPVSRHKPLALAIFLLLSAPLLSAVTQPQHHSLPKGQKHESHHEIDQMEQAWRNAMMTADVGSMSSLLADDFISIGANGTLHTKEETLARLKNWREHHTALDLSDRKVRFYGTTAVVTSLANVTGVNSDGEPSGSYRYTRVYVRNAQGKWKIVSFEASQIRESREQK